MMDLDDAVSRVENGVGAALLRARLLRAPAPRILDRYAIERVLGRGASGVVVAATDERLRRPVALKLSIATSSDDAHLDEARALAALDHPNVVRVLDADVAEAPLAEQPLRLRVIVMQLVDGVNLRTWLREAPRTPEQIAGVFIGAGLGLAAAHEQRIIHRDFKPENVLVRRDGVAQVIDFGFAVASRSTSSATLTEIAGTDPYLAPEARAGRPTASSDQFAFAVSVVDALTGSPTPAVVRPVEVDPRLWSVLQRASDDDPRKRYPSMHALVGAVRAATRRRWTRWVAAAAGLVTAGALVAGISLHFAPGAGVARAC